jgi:hypothetical protein
MSRASSPPPMNNPLPFLSDNAENPQDDENENDDKQQANEPAADVNVERCNHAANPSATLAAISCDRQQ